MKTKSLTGAVLTVMLVAACDPAQRDTRASPNSSLTSSGAVSLVDARSIAIAQVPGGEIEEAELETEEGVEAYSVDVVLDGVETEVRIDPGSGAVLSVTREGAADDDGDEADDDEAGADDDDDPGVRF